jgi:methionine synthase II (cobalamin-independent)
MNTFLPTTLVGSYPQPDWLIDRAKLAGRFPPRVRAKELWRIAPEWLEQAQDDATLLAIRDQERAGLDIITDGEMRRESYSNRFATALEGVDIDNPGTALDRSGHPNPVLGVTGTTAMHICFGYAAIIHERPSGYSFLPELEGADVRQISIETAQSHLDCSVLAALPSKTILLGVLDLSDMNVETPAIVAERIRRALPYVGANRIVVAPDCGLKYMLRDIAFAKMRAMAEGAFVVRRELS